MQKLFKPAFWSWILAILLLAASTAIAEEASDKPAEGKSKKDDYYTLMKVFADTLDQVERNYVKPVSRRELMEAAIGGILGKLDPYSNYISRDDMARFKSTVESQFGGIGIQITIDHEQLKVLSPLVGTPAYRAGLQSGDNISRSRARRPMAFRSKKPSSGSKGKRAPASR